MATTTRNTVLDAIDETYKALLSVAEMTEGRGHKVSQRAFTEARKGEEELVELTQKWIDTPTGFFDNLGAILDAQARAQRRALELARASLEGAADYRAEVREALSRVIRANRTAAEATVEAARETAQTAVERIRRREEEEEETPAPRAAGAKTNRVPVGARAGTSGDG